MSNQETKIQNLINICEDAREFYTDATDQTDDVAKKKLFRNMADIRKSIIVDLRDHMRKKEMEMEKPSATMGGRFNKFIGETMASWSDNSDKQLITYLEEAEDRCLHSFEDASNDNELPLDTRALVSQKLETLQRTHDYMKELKEVVKAAA